MRIKKQLVSSLLAVSMLVSMPVMAQDRSEEMDNSPKVLGALTRKVPTKEEVLGNILTGALQTMHFSQKRIDDDLSSKAFKIFLERVDYGKQFLLKKDVEQLEEFEDKMDEELKKGNLTIVQKSSEILKPRIKMLEKHMEQVLSKPLKFDGKEMLETDPKKRDFVKTEKELKERWVKILKYEVLTRMLDKKDEQEGISNDDEDKPKKKKVVKAEKKKSMKELEAEARDVVKKRYSKYFHRLLDEKQNDKLDKFYNSFARVFDPHTHYLIPEEKEDFDIDMSGQLQGIGALLREEGSYIKVERVIPGSASWKGKELESEDIILAVGQSDEDPVDVVDMSLRDAVKMIRGPKGTTVKLTVKKPDGTIKVIPIVRDVVVIEESYAKSSVITDKETGKKIGYIHLPKFYRDFSNSLGKNCSTDVANEVKRLKAENVEGIVLDLRNNGGGALEDARIMSGLFIKKGPIVQVKASNGAKEILADTDPKIQFKKPLVVLVNRFSASASEILAAAMQDYGRAVVVGTSDRTHGKGTVQALIDLDNYASPLASSYKPLGALKITIQMFYRITGGSTQFRGVVPDIVLPDPYAYIDSGESSLDYAIPYHEVEPVSYDKWDRYSYDVSKLKKSSTKRVEKSPHFQKVVESVKWYNDRKENSTRSLNLSMMEKDREEVRKKTKEFKTESEFAHLDIKTFIDAKDEVGKELKENFEKQLRTDPVIEESMHIISDIIQNSGPKVSKN